MNDRQFAFRALDPQGRTETGVVAGASRTDAADTLRARGLSPYALREKTGARAWFPVSHTRLSDEEMSDVLLDLASLLDGGLTLAKAFDALQSDAYGHEVRRLARDANARLLSGDPVQSLLNAGGREDFLAGILRAGLVGGDLAQALKAGADILRAARQAQSELVAALSYPAFVLIAFVFAISVVLGVVAPALAPIAGELRQTDGFLKLLVGAGMVFDAHGVQMLIALAIAALSIWVVLFSRAWPLTAGRIHACGPFARTVREIQMGAWARAAGMLMSSGARAVDAVEAAIPFCQNAWLLRELRRVENRMRDGETLSRSLTAIGLAPDVIVRMTSVGERSGALGPMLARAGALAQTRAIRRVKTVAGVVGPLALLVMGLIVGSVTAGLLSAISSIGAEALS